MDTIIYFYHSRDAQDFITEKYEEDDYCLIRAGVPPFVWENVSRVEETFTQGKNETSRNFFARWIKGRTRTKRAQQKETEAQHKETGEQHKETGEQHKETGEQRKETEAQYKETGEQHKEKRKQDSCSQQIQTQVQEWLTVLGMFCENRHRSYCVYEEFLRKKIRTPEGKNLWPSWDIPEFSDYRERRWVDKLMPQAIHSAYIIVGWESCVPELLYEYARKMRSVKLILFRKQYCVEVQEFIDIFYQDTGLAVEIQLLEEGESMARVRPKSALPANVLDFSGEETLSAGDMPAGSVWLDMDSMEAKNRRIKARKPEVFYFSLKKAWNQYQKGPAHLDTMVKNRYNT